MKRLLFLAMLLTVFIDVKAQNKSQSSASKNKTNIDKPISVKKGVDFPGGMTAFYKFLGKNIKFPDPEIDVQGKVIISFVIENDGRLTNFKIIRSLGPKYDAEVIRVMKLSPRWKPAVENGKPIKSDYTVPINFTISE